MQRLQKLIPISNDLPIKLQDKKWVSDFCDLVRRGLHISTASRKQGVSPEVVQSWLHEGQDEQSPYHDFFLKVLDADAELELEMVGRFKELATSTKNHRAVAAFLERRFKSNWGEVKEINVTGQIDHNLNKPDLSKLSDVQLQQYIENAETNRRLLEGTTIDVPSERLQ